MALNDIQITQLPNSTEVEEFDAFVVQRGGANYNVLVEAILASHADRVDNPHNVSKSQVGLSNVDNYTISDSYTLNNSESYASSKALLDGINYSVSVAASSLSSHTSNTLNPHNVTKGQVGLSNIQNYGVTSNVGTRSDLYANQLGLNNAKQEAISSAYAYSNQHAERLDNPHAVSKSQVGLGLVQNYSATTSKDSASSSLYATAKAMNDGWNYALTQSTNALNSHLTDYDNPHLVNKTDVGLSNVPNWQAGSTTMGSSATTFPNEVSVKNYIDAAINNLFNQTMPIGIIIGLANDLYTPSSLGWNGVWEEIGVGQNLRQKELGETTGDSYGSNTVTINSNNLPTHTHSDSFSASDSGHEHNFPTENGGQVKVDSDNNGVSVIKRTSTYNRSTITASSNITISGSVGNNSTSNTPISTKGSYVAVRYWKRIS